MKRLLLHLVVTLCAALQQTLKQQGFYYGTVTGEKSAETTVAIRRYQIRNGLQVTGEINEETLRSLNSRSNSVATAFQSNAKSAANQPTSIRPDAGSRVTQSSPRFHPANRIDSWMLILHILQVFTNPRHLG